MLKVRQQIGGLGNLMFKQAYLYAQVRRGAIPDVYVQSDKYFKEFTGEIKRMFGDGISFIDKVSLHIRRGDYFDKGDFYVNLTDTDYYQKAIQMFPKDKFLVFCADRQGRDKEDKEWVKNFMDTLVPDRWELWESEEETDDLNAMASCKSNIMANSSFSWWGAFLNMNPNKKVVCPSKWFTDGVERVELLEEWTKI